MNFRLKLLIVFVAAVAVWIFSAPYLATRLIVEKPIKRADAILVLSGSSVYLERTQKAALLFSQGVASKILLTDDGGRAGWSREKEENPPFVRLAKESLIENGVPADSIEILEPNVSGTDSEAEALLKKSDEDDLRSVLLVTSAYHTRRTLWVFESVFAVNNRTLEFGIEGAATGQQTPPPETWWLTPRGWKMVAGEYLKLVFFWLSH